MQVFEFHFNPPKHSDNQKLIFDSFCFEPENIYERRKGSLYMVGVLKNVAGQNLKLLDQMSDLIKERYYSSLVVSPEKSLKEGLKRANEFLEDLSKKGNVGWLGNLSFAVFSINFSQKNGQGDLNFTKINDLKILLLREGEIIDIDQKLNFDEIEPYPLKIFGNIVSGKLIENDQILILTKEVSEFFQSPPKFSEGKFGRAGQNILSEIAKTKPFDPDFSNKIKQILNNKKQELLKISGVCLLISLSKETKTQKREIISVKKITKGFPLKWPPKIQIAIPHFNFTLFKRIKILCQNFGLKVKQNFNNLIRNKKLILISIFILLLATGFFVFQAKEEQTKLDLGAKELLIVQDFDENEFISKKMSVLKENAPENFESNIFCDYNSNLYSLNNIDGEIIKYALLGEQIWAEPKVWTKSDSLIGAKSIAIDGSIWILNQDNSINRYYAGKIQETFVLDISPFPENFSRIFTLETLPYLYVLEPCEKRIVILDKDGQIIKQFQNEKFDNLLDFAVSGDGKTIHLLNNSKVYQVQF
ncbi:hypothetical protein KAU40_00125 [Candidatus Parcubacteria bacterium]|nr:hypothetical protein [Candidatus Parcubacteria bacterium]